MKFSVKHIIYILSIAVMVTSCDLFELDNFEEPDAEVYGAIIDEKTGETINQPIGTSEEAANFEVIEYGYEIREPQSWRIKSNGEYRNKLVFSGTYDIVLNRGNFVKLDTLKEYEIDSGENELNFEVTPYIRFLESDISREGDIIKATFKLEYGHDVGKVDEITLFAHKDRFAGETHNVADVSEDVSDLNINHENNDAFRDSTFTLEIDLNRYPGTQLYEERRYFFRIGAVAENLEEGVPNKYNYTEPYGFDLNQDEDE